ncbi:MAG: hypothetical protein PHT30_03860 [Bacilli bacterium]|nr:hypothetical protein [Bacilli bacterium]
MKRPLLMVLSLSAMLSSCVIVNPIYPQDTLNLDLYQEAIVLDLTNDNEEELIDPSFSDEENLRTYLNRTHAAVKSVDSYENIYNGRGALQIGKSGTQKEGELIFTLKNTFYADALAINVYPYFIESYDYFNGKTNVIYDTFAISINEREYIQVFGNDELAPSHLTFAFNQSVSEITLKSEKGRGYIYEILIYQR